MNLACTSVPPIVTKRQAPSVQVFPLCAVQNRTKRSNSPGSKAVSTVNFTASSIASGSECSHSQTTDRQSRSLERNSNGNSNPFHKRFVETQTIQPTTTKEGTTSLTTLLANQGHGCGKPGSKQHSASHVAQWLQDQKRDNRVPYLGVVQQGMSREG